MNQRRIARFHTITSIAPHLLHYVRVLEFDPSNNAVRSLFANSTTLEEVRLVGFHGDTHNMRSIAKILSLQSVTRLTVHANSAYYVEIIPIIRLCPQLRSLTISRVMFDRLARCEPTTSKAIQLESLTVDRSHPQSLADLAENVLDLTQLRSLSAQFYPYIHADHSRIVRVVPVVEKLLRSIDGTLEHLRLDVYLREPLHKLINLSSLRTLELCPPAPARFQKSFVTYETILGWLLASLESLECTSLESITIQQVPLTDTSIELASQIDFHLSKLPRLLLANVRITLESVPARDLFPLLNGRGVLRQYYPTFQ